MASRNFGPTLTHSLTSILMRISQVYTAKLVEHDIQKLNARAKMAFSFGFSGDDIDAPLGNAHETSSPVGNTAPAQPASAFPVAGKPQLPPTRHDLAQLLARLPSKIAYSCLDVALDDGRGVPTARIPRRELWDVRLQLMAEDDVGDREHDAEGLGEHDVKTGVYEGGFKSWESSVDLVKVLAAESHLASLQGRPVRVIEVCDEGHGGVSLCLLARC